MTPQGWEFARSVIAQALGTVIGGGVLALIGVAVGALNTPWLTVSVIALGASTISLAFMVRAVVHLSLMARRRDERDQSSSAAISSNDQM